MQPSDSTDPIPRKEGTQAMMISPEAYAEELKTDDLQNLIDKFDAMLKEIEGTKQ